MIIRRLRVQRFRKFVDQDLVCAPGLNVVRGPNDAGKSTLHLAFSAALFPSQPREVKSYGPWGEDRPGEISVEFESDGKAYRLRRDFAGRRVVLESTQETLEAPRLVEARIGDLVGVSGASVFRAILHIGQWELAALEEGAQREIGGRLSRIVTGGDTDGVQVLRDLERYITEQEVGMARPAKNPGPLKRESDELARLAELRARLSDEVQEIEIAAAERDRLALQCAEQDNEMRAGEALADANRRLHEADRQCELLARRADELQGLLTQVDAAAHDLAAASAAAAALQSAPSPAAAEALRAALVREQTLEETMGEAEEAARFAISQRPAWTAPAPSTPRPAWTQFGLVAMLSAMAIGITLLLTGRVYWGAGILLGSLLLGVVIAAALAGSTPQPAWPMFGLVAMGSAMAVGIALLIYGMLAWGLGVVLGSLLLTVIIAFAMGARVAESRERTAEVEKVLAARRRDVMEATGAMQGQLTALGATSVDDALDRAARAEEARQERETAQRLLDGLLRGRDRDSLAKELSRALRDLGVARSVRDDPDLSMKRLEPSAYQRLGTEMARRRETLERMKRDLQRLEGRLAAHSRYADLAAVEEQISELEARAARRARQMHALRLARNVLDAAHRETIVSGKVVLEEHAGRYLRELSGGAYERVRVDDQTLDPQVWVGGPKEWADVEAREVGSAGVHQCYLALRLALVEMLCSDRNPPLFLDDPFLDYDAERQAAAIQCLRTIARERQVFLFTCRDAYDTAADRVIMIGDGERVVGDAAAGIRSERGVARRRP